VSDIGQSGISQRSGGPSPDALELKFSGTTDLQLDLDRTQEVEVRVRGIVTTHGFSDKYDKHGNVEHTTKAVTLKIDELVEISVIPRRRRDVDIGQMDLDDVTAEATEAPEEIVDAVVVGELEAGEPEPAAEEPAGEPEGPDVDPPPEEPAEDDPDLEWK
jgi:hypothetical protein